MRTWPRRDIGPRDLGAGNFRRLLADDHELAAWERFALRTANTPGRERVVLRLAFNDQTGGSWYLWATYRFTNRELAVDRVQLEIESIHIPNEGHPTAATPSELAGEAIFEAREAH